MDYEVTTDPGAFPGQTRLDRGVLDAVVRHRVRWLDVVARVVTEIGGFWVLTAVVIVCAIVWRRRVGDWTGSVVLVTVGLAASWLTSLLKAGFERPRPPIDLRLTQAGGYALPSGHSLQSAAIWGTVAVLVASQVPRALRRRAWSAAAAMAFAVGLSRIYLGVHWTTDVLAGWAIGAVLVAVAGVAMRSRSRR